MCARLPLPLAVALFRFYRLHTTYEYNASTYHQEKSNEHTQSVVIRPLRSISSGNTKIDSSGNITVWYANVCHQRKKEP